MTRRWTLGWGIVTACAVLGCAGGEATAGAGATTGASGDEAVAEAEAPPPPPDPLRMLPDDAFAVVDVNVDELRNTAYFERLVTWLVGQARPSPEQERLARDLLDRTHRVLLGAIRPGTRDQDPEIVVVARGDYADGQLERLMSQADGKAVQVQTIAGQPVYVEADIWAAEVRGPTWVFASAGWIRSLLNRALPGVSGNSPLEQPDLAPVAQRVDFGEDTITGVARIPPEIRERVGDDRWLSRSTGQALRVAGFQAHIDRHVDVELVVRTAGASSARRLADRSGALLEWAGSNVFVGLLGLRPLFDGARVRAEAEDAVLTLHIDEVEVDRLLTKFEAMAGQVLRQQGVDLDVRSRTGAAPAGP